MITILASIPMCNNVNLGSLEIRVSTYISAKLKKRTYMYDSLQFPVEINTRGSKTLTTFIPFHTKYDLQEQFWLFSHSYLQNGMLWLLNNFDTFHRTFPEWKDEFCYQLHSRTPYRSVSLCHLESLEKSLCCLWLLLLASHRNLKYMMHCTSCGFYVITLPHT